MVIDSTMKAYKGYEGKTLLSIYLVTRKIGMDSFNSSLFGPVETATWTHWTGEPLQRIQLLNDGNIKILCFCSSPHNSCHYLFTIFHLLFFSSCIGSIPFYFFIFLFSSFLYLLCVILDVLHLLCVCIDCILCIGQVNLYGFVQ
jgi:hypothetical protein